jgi:ATP-binding cassette subfamily B protein
MVGPPPEEPHDERGHRTADDPTHDRHTPPRPPDAGPRRRPAALRLALRFYFRELARHKLLSATALVLPALGTIGLAYLPALFVGQLVGRLAPGRR